MSQKEQFIHAMQKLTFLRETESRDQKKRSEEGLALVKDFQKTVGLWLEGIPSVKISTMPITFSGAELLEMTLVDEICIDIGSVEVTFTPRFLKSKLTYEISSTGHQTITLIEDGGLWFAKSNHNSTSSQFSQELFFQILNGFVPAK